MGSGQQYDLHEIIKKSSSQKMKEHLESLQKFLDRGYRIEDQDEQEETGLHGEQISTTLVTTLRPSASTLPMIKFEAKQIFGRYDFQKGVLQPWDEPQFQIKMFQKSADIKQFNAPWQGFDLP